MSDVTQILSAIGRGESQATADLLPLVYDELKHLALARMSSERPDHTLQATALVHEAYVRLVDTDRVENWDSRGHFFAAAAEAMRRILVDWAARKQSLKRGGHYQRVELTDELAGRLPDTPDNLLDLNESLELLEQEDDTAAGLVKLRLFAGLSVADAGRALGMSRSAAYENWRYACAWFASHLGEPPS